MEGVKPVSLRPKWYTVAQVAELLGYGETKVRMLIIAGDLRSLKDGRSRRVLPEWVDEYVARRAAQAEEHWWRREPATVNGEGSIFPYRTGYAAYAWITTPAGRRQRKYVYGKDAGDGAREVARAHAGRRGGTGAPQCRRGWRTSWSAGWRRRSQPDLAPTTAANYALFTRLYIVPGPGSRRLDRLTVRDVQLWMNELKTRCQCCHQGKDAGGRSSRVLRGRELLPPGCLGVDAHQAWTVLQSALSAAVREELMTRNVAALGARASRLGPSGRRPGRLSSRAGSWRAPGR